MRVVGSLVAWRRNCLGGNGREEGGSYSPRLDKKRSLHQCQLSSRNQCSNGQRRRSCAESGEDEADVEEARLSAKCAKWRWGPVVSGWVGVLARVEGKELAQVG